MGQLCCRKHKRPLQSPPAAAQDSALPLPRGCCDASDGKRCAPGLLSYVWRARTIHTLLLLPRKHTQGLLGGHVEAALNRGVHAGGRHPPARRKQQRTHWVKMMSVYLRCRAVQAPAAPAASRASHHTALHDLLCVQGASCQPLGSGRRATQRSTCAAGHSSHLTNKGRYARRGRPKVPPSPV